MNNLKMMAIFFVVILMACAGSPMRLSMMSAEELKTAKLGDLCNAYGRMRNDKVKQELKRRNALTAEEWAAVEEKKIFIGMYTCAAMASWGQPNRVNKSATRFGASEQWVYDNCRLCKGRYVYIEGGKVSGWN